MTTPTTTPSHVDTSELNDSVRWLFVSLGTVCWLNGIFGNIVVLCTLAIRSGLKSPHNIFIGHLTLADLFVVGYGLPFWLWDLVTDSHPTENAVHCAANGYLGFMCSWSSLLFLWTISCNRYINVCHHATYKKWQVTSWRASWFCVAVWVISAACATFPLFKPGSYIYEAKTRLCFLNRTELDSYVYVSISIPVIIILAFIAFFNFSIFRLWRMNKKRVNQWIGRTTPASLRITTTPPLPPHYSEDNNNRDDDDLQNSSSLSEGDTSSNARGEPTTSDPLVTVAPMSKAGLVSTSNQTTTGLLSTHPEVVGLQSSEIFNLNNSSPAPSVSEICGKSCEKFSPSLNNQSKSKPTASVNMASISRPQKTSESCSTPTVVHISSEPALIGPKNLYQQFRHTTAVVRGHGSSNNRGLVRSLLAVYLCLVALFLTSVLLSALDALVGVPQWLSLLSIFLFFTNSSINWLLYSAFNKGFRRDCRYVMARCCTCRWRRCIGKLGNNRVNSLK